MRYFDALIEAHRVGVVSDHVHLGLGSAPTLDEAQEAMAERHLTALALIDGQVVVDVGCGFGGALRRIDARFRRMHLVGVNIDCRQIDIASQGAWCNPVDWRLCDAANFAEERSFADRLLSLEAMFHFPDPAGFLSAAARALKPGGIMVGSTILLGSAGPSRRVVCDGFAPWPHPDLTLDELIAIAERAGLAVRAVEDLSPDCIPAFSFMCPPCPANLTDDPVTELKRLFQTGAASYPMLVLERDQAGGKTQK